MWVVFFIQLLVLAAVGLSFDLDGWRSRDPTHTHDRLGGRSGFNFQKRKTRWEDSTWSPIEQRHHLDYNLT